MVRSLQDLATGRVGINDLSGPVAIGQAASAGLSEGFGQAVLNILLMIVMFTVNLGIVNLLPLPALDGGRIVLLLLEGVRGKPLPAKVEQWINVCGMALLLALMMFVTMQDVGRLL